MLELPTPQSGQQVSEALDARGRTAASLAKRLAHPSARRFYHRSLMGMMIPGRYYFVTWTTTPESGDVDSHWPALRKWLKRYRPGSAWAYCITKEGRGGGVIHMIIRLGKKEARLEVQDLREHWSTLTGARQIVIRRVQRARKAQLARYMSDQRRKKAVAGEVAFQDLMKRWRWSKGWLPVKWTRAFGRFWWHCRDMPPDVRDQLIVEWLRRCHSDPNQVENLPNFQGNARGPPQ